MCLVTRAQTAAICAALEITEDMLLAKMEEIRLSPAGKYWQTCETACGRGGITDLQRYLRDQVYHAFLYAESQRSVMANREAERRKTCCKKTSKSPRTAHHSPFTMTELWRRGFSGEYWSTAMQG